MFNHHSFIINTICEFVAVYLPLPASPSLYVCVCVCVCGFEWKFELLLLSLRWTEQMGEQTHTQIHTYTINDYPCGTVECLNTNVASPPGATLQGQWRTPYYFSLSLSLSLSVSLSVSLCLSLHQVTVVIPREPHVSAKQSLCIKYISHHSLSI